MDTRPILSSAQNPQIRRVRRWIEKPRQCRQDGIFLADGIHLVEEALSAGLTCLDLFVDNDRLLGSRGPKLEDPDSASATRSPRHEELFRLLEASRGLAARVHMVTPSVFRAISPVESPQGIVGVFQRPTPSLVRTPTSPHALVAAGIQDPSNLGSMVRSARATGIGELLATRGTVDPFHHRALRASMGATFHIQIRAELEQEELLRTLAESGRRTIALSLHGETSIAQLDPSIPSALVFGSEGGGLPAEFEASIDLRVRIPMEPGVESLAVPAAAAVACYWLYLGGRERGADSEFRLGRDPEAR